MATQKYTGRWLGFAGVIVSLASIFTASRISDGAVYWVVTAVLPLAGFAMALVAYRRAKADGSRLNDPRAALAVTGLFLVFVVFAGIFATIMSIADR